MSEAHLRSILREWTTHYNGGRPHSALGSGVQDPPKEYVKAPKSASCHRLVAGTLVLARSVMGGLHHEYSLALFPARA
jgi:putative transposase